MHLQDMPLFTKETIKRDCCHRCGDGTKYLPPKGLSLHLGCGYVKLDGYVNVDKFEPANMLVDLQVFPWPWEDNSVDIITSRDWLEHMTNYHGTVREMHRILKPDGLLEVYVPHFRHPNNPWPQQHVNEFGIVTMQRWCEDYSPYDLPHLFDTVKCEHHFGDKTRWLNRIANINPLAWEWFQLPVGSVHYIGRKVTCQNCSV